MRAVRFLPFFFDQLDDYLGDQRGEDGSPSATDFLLFDLPRVRDLLAADFEGCTLPVPPGNDVRIFSGVGGLVQGFCLFAELSKDDAVEVLAIVFDEFDDL